jgi:hypothetical protein
LLPARGGHDPRHSPGLPSQIDTISTVGKRHELEAQQGRRQVQERRDAGAADSAGGGGGGGSGWRGQRAAGLRGGAGRRPGGRRGAGGAGGGGRARAGAALRARAAGHGGAGVRVRPEGRAADPLRRRRAPPRRRRRQAPVDALGDRQRARLWLYSGDTYDADRHRLTTVDGVPAMIDSTLLNLRVRIDLPCTCIYRDGRS